ncbi:MAG TPA: holo-ACP synthase [Chthoniobacterales bacterium]|nr:holo-ACP synthase [Chthoniobacterales bacterium]
MSVLGVGIDIIETARIEHSLERFGDRFKHRVFTDDEIAYCESMKFPARHFAARFAAKEAVSKAFGTGIGGTMGWRDIEVHRQESGQPFIVLQGSAKQHADTRGISSISVSLSHADAYSAAVIVLET